jgi:serine/threonine protein kinase
MEREKFYLRSPSGTVGPFNRTKLTALAADGRLTPAHRVSMDGQTWMPAQRVEGLFTNASAASAAPAESGNVPAKPPVPEVTADETLVPPILDTSPAPAPLPKPSPIPRKMVFVSHCRENVAVAREIISGLKAAGVSCWIDTQDIAPGAKWRQEILSGIQDCQLLLLLCTSKAFSSKWVLRELTQAEKRGIPILPVRLERVTPPDEFDLYIDEYQWIDAEGPVESHMGEIVDGVKRCLRLPVKKPAEPDPSAMPKQIGHYHILNSLGDEGTGTTYKAEQHEPISRTVALKVIKPGVEIARFESERQALLRMDHQGIVRVLDAGKSEKGQPYFVTEYVSGKPIIEFADTERLSIQARLELFLQACDAISHAHSKAIIHRDLKPCNVLALFSDDRPTVKVINFGIAKALTDERLTYQTISSDGAHDPESYTSLSPEQAQRSDDLDTRTDVYSLGALLYELLAGFKPFDLEALRRVTDAEARQIICDQKPLEPSARLKALGEQAVRIAELRQTTPAALSHKLRHELEWVPLMAMRKERQLRYASPLLLVEDIQNYLKSEPLDAAAKTNRYRLRKFAWRNRAVLTPIIVSLLAIGLATVVYVVRIRTAERIAIDERQNAVKQEQNAVKQQQLATEQKQNAIKQEQNAIKQEQIAKAVNGFLLDALRRADPKQGNKFTMNEAIDDSVKLLNDRNRKDELPIAVQAAMWDTVGNVRRALGFYDEAERNLERSLTMRRQVLSADDPDIGRTLDHLGHLWKDRYDQQKDQQEYYENAEKNYSEALAIFRRSLPPDDLDIATTLNDRASLLQSGGRLADAEAYCTEALGIRQKKRAPDADVLQSMGTLVDILVKKGGMSNFVRADAQMDEALTVAKSLAPDDPNLARLKIQQGMLLKAEAKLDKVENRSDTAEVRLQKAEDVCREALEIDLRTLPPGHGYIERALKKLNDVRGERNERAVTLADEQKRLSNSGEPPPNKLSPLTPSDTLALQAGEVQIIMRRFPPAGVSGPVEGRVKYLSETDVTNAQFAEFCRSTGYETTAERRFKKSDASDTERFSYVFARNRSTREEIIDPDIQSWKSYPGPDLPVVMVSHDDAVAFCGWLGEKAPGLIVRLPLAEEWAVACQAGTTTRYWWGNNALEGAGKKINVLASPKDEFVFQQPVRTYGANPWGFYDILGNVELWAGNDVNHQGKATTVGWSWQDTAGDMSPRLRKAQLCNDRIGFRVLAIKPQ